jgi:hypothetical protein
MTPVVSLFQQHELSCTVSLVELLIKEVETPYPIPKVRLLIVQKHQYRKD